MDRGNGSQWAEGDTMLLAPRAQALREQEGPAAYDSGLGNRGAENGAPAGLTQPSLVANSGLKRIGGKLTDFSGIVAPVNEHWRRWTRPNAA
jgi:hypothetical protein